MTLLQKIHFLENKANNRWNIVRTTTDAKVALETACHIFVEDKKQQRYKNEGLKVSIYILH